MDTLAANSTNCSKPKVVAIAGGIGSGKSVVSRILLCLGYDVYDCDSRAKALMDSDMEIKRLIDSRVCPGALRPDHTLDRRLISETVFSDASKLLALNEIVHGAVRDDIHRWILSHADDKAVFVETAILYQSGLDRMVDLVWEVTAPEEVRIERVCLRNNLSVSEVKARMESQCVVVENPHPRVEVIVNDGTHSVLEAVDRLLRRLKSAPKAPFGT